MKKHVPFLCVLILSIAACNANANAAGNCVTAMEAKASWKTLFQRQLKVLDPARAATMAKISADIIDGNSEAFSLDVAGIDPNTPFKLHGGDMTMLELASAACQFSIVKQLVAAGAAVDGNDSSAPLVAASARGQDGIVEYLLQHGAKLSKVDNDGHTALEKAIRQRQLSSAKVLLSYGDDINRRLPSGMTILDIVGNGTDSESKAIASELRARGAVSGTAVK